MCYKRSASEYIFQYGVVVRVADLIETHFEMSKPDYDLALKLKYLCKYTVNIRELIN